MTHESTDRPVLVELMVSGPPTGWTAAGFSVGPDATVQLGAAAVRLVGAQEAGGGARGIVGWTLGEVDVTGGHLDGLPTRVVGPDSPIGDTDPSDDRGGPSTQPGQPHATHPNGATGIDHVVVSTPDLDRTIAACEVAGLRCRRIREAGTPDQPMRQAFFRLGSTILEVVGGPVGSERTAADDPARWFGLAVDVADLDETAALLGPGLGRIKAAVQPGRRIATLRHRDLGLSVPVALMDDHGDR